MSLRSELESLNTAVAALLSVLGGQSTARPATPATSPISEYAQRSTGASNPSNPVPRTSSTGGSGQSGSVSIDQTKLLQLVNMTRRFVRYSREGNIPSKEQRKYARRSIKAVKHLLPVSDIRSDIL